MTVLPNVHRWVANAASRHAMARARQRSCIALLAVFGAAGTVSSLLLGPRSFFGPWSVLGLLGYATVTTLVVLRGGGEPVWRWFVPLVALTEVCGVQQLGPDAHLLLPEICLGVFWTALFLPTEQVRQAASWMGLATLSEFAALHITTVSVLTVAVSMVTMFVGAALVHGLVLAFRESQEQLERAHAIAHHDAATDPLTGLFNRRQFLTELPTLRPAALLLVDIDHFKTINDTYGHACGDAVLRIVAARIQREAGNARVARWGGEEFTVIAPAADDAEVDARAEAIRSAIAHDPISIDGVEIPVTVSVGGHLWGPESFQDAFGEADANLFAAKRNGRNRIATRV